jgi:hypothetical protein
MGARLRLRLSLPCPSEDIPGELRAASGWRWCGAGGLRFFSWLPKPQRSREPPEEFKPSLALLGSYLLGENSRLVTLLRVEGTESWPG